MRKRTVNRMRFVVQNALKNLCRYRTRCMMFGGILFLLTSVFMSAVGLYGSEGILSKTSGFALRLAWISGILLVITFDMSLRLTIAVRKDEISVIYILGIGLAMCMLMLWIEYFIFFTLIWLLGSTTGSMIAGNADWCCIAAGPAVSGLLTAIRLAGTYIAIRRRTPADFMKEG